MRFLLFTFIFLFSVSILLAQKSGVTHSLEKRTVLMNGVAHVSQHETLDNALITFKDDEITLVADARLVRMRLEGYETIPVSQQHVYAITTDSVSENSLKNLRGMVIKNKKTGNTFLIHYIYPDEASPLLATGEPANMVVLEKPIAGTKKNKICQIIIDGKKQDVADFRLKSLKN